MFGAVDKNKDNKIASEFPAWYQERQMENLQEHIDQIDRGIRSGRFSSDEIHEHKAEKARLEARMDSILKSRPNPSDSERDTLRKYYKSFGSKIQAALFTRSEMQLGLASAHEEAKRMKKPCISLTPEECSIAISCNVMPDKNKMVSRDGAAKVFKLLGRILGEPANVEHLRLDKKTDTHIPMEVAAPKPVAVEHLAGTSQEQPTTVKLTKSGKPDKRYKG